MLHWLILLETNKQLSLGTDSNCVPKDILSPFLYIRRGVLGDSYLRNSLNYEPSDIEKLISIYDIQYNDKF